MRIRSITELDRTDFSHLPNPAASKNNCARALQQYGEIQIFFDFEEVLAEPGLTTMDFHNLEKAFNDGAHIAVIYNPEKFRPDLN